MRLVCTLSLSILAVAVSACDSKPAQEPKITASEAARPVPPPSDSRDPRRVLVAWAKAVSLKQWDEAYGYWADHGKGSGVSLPAFRARWGQLSEPELEIREGRAESAAGSLFYTAPVTLIDGSRRMEGKVVLRKAGSAGASDPEQARWHIESTTLKP